MINDFWNLLKRELKIGFKDFFTIISFSSFFLISILIFVFAFGSIPIEIGMIYKPIIWVILIFSIMLVSENFTYNDYLDGSLKELQFLGYPEEMIIFSKSIVMWLMIIIPSLFLVPISSIFFKLSLTDSLLLFMSIFLASPSLILISLVASLFSIQLKSNKILQFIIIFPFYIPIIIFTTSIGHNQDKLYDNNFLILIGIFFITLPISLLTSRLIMREINR